MTLERFPAIIFDFDGTLVDSAADLRTALNMLLAEARLPAQPIEAVRRMIGDGALKLVERGFAAAGRPVAGDALARQGQRFLELYEPISADSTQPYPGWSRPWSGWPRPGTASACAPTSPSAPPG